MKKYFEEKFGGKILPAVNRGAVNRGFTVVRFGEMLLNS